MEAGTTSDTYGSGSTNRTHITPGRYYTTRTCDRFLITVRDFPTFDCSKETVSSNSQEMSVMHTHEYYTFPILTGYYTLKWIKEANFHILRNKTITDIYIYTHRYFLFIILVYMHCQSFSNCLFIRICLKRFTYPASEILNYQKYLSLSLAEMSSHNLYLIFRVLHFFRMCHQYILYKKVYSDKNVISTYIYIPRQN